MNLPYPFWADLTTVQFEALAASPIAERLVAVLPVAATEQHGPHLPVNVDSVLVDGIINAALPHMGWAQRNPNMAGEPLAPDVVPVLFMPTQKLGLSPEHSRFAGTITLSPQTLMALWLDIGASVARAGIKKLVIFNSHGGQVSMMDIVARELRVQHGLIVYHCSWFNLPLVDTATGEDVNGLFSSHEHRFGAHAGEIETSMMLALRPDLVDMTKAENFHSTSEDRAARHAILGNGKSAKLAWMMQDYNAKGAAGNAAAASADRGLRVVQAAGQALAGLLVEVSDLPLDTLRN